MIEELSKSWKSLAKAALYKYNVRQITPIYTI